MQVEENQYNRNLFAKSSSARSRQGSEFGRHGKEELILISAREVGKEIIFA
jgi:hypothetical protein